MPSRTAASSARGANRTRHAQSPALSRDHDSAIRSSPSRGVVQRNAPSSSDSASEEQDYQGGDDDDDSDDDDEDDEEEEEEEVADEDDESPFKFLQNFDPDLFGAFEASLASQGRRSQSELTAPTQQARISTQQSALNGNDADFYSNMIQMLTHVLGSSNPVAWNGQATPGSQLAPSPFALPQSSPAPTPGQTLRHNTHDLTARAREPKKSSRQPGISELQPLIHALISRLGGDHRSPRHPVGEQDLTALLQSLMEQQQRQQAGTPFRQQNYDTTGMYSVANTPSGLHRPGLDSTQPMHFADLIFEDEDEDDPDFNPNLNPDLPLPSAWSMAVNDVVGSKESRAAAAAVAASTTGTPAVRTPARQLESEHVTHSSMMSSRRASDDAITNTQSTLQNGEDMMPGQSSSVLVFSPSGRPVRSTRFRQQSPSFPADRGDIAPLQAQQFAEDRAASHEMAAARQSGPLSAQVGSEQSLTRNSADGDRPLPRKRGRKPILDAAEAHRRRVQRNIEYQRLRRQTKKIEETEQSETVSELRAEVKFLRAEMERIREENATLRAQRELAELQRNSRYQDHQYRRDEASTSPWTTFESPMTDAQYDHRHPSASRHSTTAWQEPSGEERRRTGRGAPHSTMAASSNPYHPRSDRFP